MMEPFGRQPPRFVPTLTDVVPQGLPLQKSDQPQEPVWEAQWGPAAPALDVPFARAVPLPKPDTARSADTTTPMPDALPSEPALEAAWLPHAPAHDGADERTAPRPESAERDVADGMDALESAGIDADTDPDAPPLALGVELDLPPQEEGAPFSWDADALQEQLVARILARVQPQLEAHLREVVADVVSQHAEAMARHLHDAVEAAVQHTVADAIAHEQIQAKLDLNAHL